MSSTNWGFLDRPYFSKSQSNDISPNGLDDFEPFAVLALVISWIKTFQVNHIYIYTYIDI